MKKCTVIRKDNKWEVKDPNNPDCPLVGPYDTKKEAEEQRRGLDNFYKRNWKVWVTL
jgi:hypothetical protein